MTRFSMNGMIRCLNSAKSIARRYVPRNDTRGMRSIDVKRCTLTSKKYVVNKRLFSGLSLMSTVGCWKAFIFVIGNG